MSKLEEVRNKKTITARKEGLAEFLNNNDVGRLSEVESIQFCLLFQEFYTPNQGEEKFTDEEIQTVGITKHDGNKCFCTYLKSDPNEPVFCGKNWLAGQKRNPKYNVGQAARFTIKHQIQEFKKENKLKVNEKCPECSEQLGSDAQVDHHETKFQNLLIDFCKENKLDLCKIGTKYNWGLGKLEFKDSTISTMWSEYHEKNAKLRWLCKKCNQNSKPK